MPKSQPIPKRPLFHPPSTQASQRTYLHPSIPSLSELRFPTSFQKSQSTPKIVTKPKSDENVDSSDEDDEDEDEGEDVIEDVVPIGRRAGFTTTKPPRKSRLSYF